LHNIETALIFVGIPALIVGVITGAVYAGGSRRARRYRPGRSFEFSPVWFLAAPERQHAERAPLDQVHAVTGANRIALPKGTAETGAAPRKESAPGVTATGGGGDWPATDPAEHDAIGGASDRW